MEILEVGKDLGKNIKKNPLPFVLGGVGIVAVLAMASRPKVEQTELVVPTGASGYPELGVNANVVIDEVNNNTRVETDRVMGGIKDTQDYIKDGIDSILGNAEENKDQILGQITDSEGNIIGSIEDWGGAIIENDNKNHAETMDRFDKVDSGIGDILGGIGEIQGSLNDYGSSLNDWQHDFNDRLDNMNNSIQNSTKPPSSSGAMNNTSVTNKKPSSSGSSSSSKTSYYKKTGYKGVSIVDGLKAIGANSSYENRKKIAQANGITGYRGTADQNTKLLNLLKKGKLKRY